MLSYNAMQQVYNTGFLLWIFSLQAQTDQKDHSKNILQQFSQVWD